jgi:ATP-dependent helicase/nuclease subunit B
VTVWTIPAPHPFLDRLVEGIFERHGRDPLDLARIQLILPTRRACRSLSDAFLRLTGGAPLLLPSMTAPGDIDADEIELAGPAELGDALDLPPAILPLPRQMLLARLIRHWGRSRGAGAILPGQALALAGDLARLIDQAHTERVSLEALEALVPADLAAHWQITVDFLGIIREHWPVLLASEGLIDPADRRNRLVASQIALWRSRPPEHPVIAAGFTTAVPAIAELLDAITRLPQGAVILPGPDGGAVDELWDAIGADPTHPQHGLARLLDHLGLAREVIPEWPGAVPPAVAPRGVLLREIMRPAAVSDRWRALGRLPDGATDGIARIDLAGPLEEAGAIALLLRRQLERPGATAMLVTPDRGLARRVAGELDRWGIEIDDSGGRPLNRTPSGAFLRLLGEAALQELAPVPLLALLQHPLAACGMAVPAFRERVRRLERKCLRGPRPAPGIAGLRTAAAGDPQNLALVDRLAEILDDFLALVAAREATLPALLEAHIACAERLAASEAESGADRLWALEAGEAVAGFVAEFLAAADRFEPIAGADYPVLFEAAVAGRVLRPRWGKHPRLQILGPVEARLQQSDLVVLGGLNEGSWPPTAAADAWLSRPMRRDFGLSPPEAAIGLAAEDFALAFGGREIVLTRAIRAEGAPTVPSRWLLRLDTVLRAVGLEALPAGRHDPAACRTWQGLLDRPDAIRAIEPPSPCPPVGLRPRQLSVTEIETWMRDPYAIYAKHVLKLAALEPLDADPGVAERGEFIHKALDKFVKSCPDVLPPDALALLEGFGRESFAEALGRPSVWAFWWPRFLAVARWVVETESARRPLLIRSHGEIRGTLAIPAPGGAFLLTAKADRIDRLQGGGLALIDYKTGALPSKKEVALGFAPQLPLEAAMAEYNAFPAVPGDAVTELGFWRLSGGDPPGEESLLDDPAALSADALDGLVGLIAAFDDPTTAYLAQPRPGWAPRYNDYTHLERLAEWGAEGGE